MATVPLSAQTLANASEDALDYGVVVNGTAGQTTVNRAGNTLRTLAYFQQRMQEALAAIGYEAPVNYAAGISLTRATQTVTYNGVVYAPIASTLPFTTTGTFETAKFRVVQGLTANQLAGATGAALVGTQQGVGNVRTVADKLLEMVSLQDYFVTGEVDHNAAWARASAAARRVYIPPGIYDLSNASFASNTEYYGAGDTSILRAKAGFELFTYDSGSADPAANLVNVTLRDVQLRGRCDTDGFNEQRHLIRTSGITNFVVHNVYFNGFQGDGWYLGSGTNTPSPTERHNYNCKSIKNRYNGINKANRNGISIIDCDGFLSEDDYFENSTQPNMPGAIDIEPNANAYHVVRNISVVRARAKNIGGNVAVYALVSSSALTVQPSNIQFIQCEADTFTAAMFHVRTNVLATATTTATQVVIDRPVGRNGSRPYYLQSGKDIKIIKGHFTDFTQSALVGQLLSADPAARVRDVLDDGSIYTRCGSTIGIAIYIFNVDYYTSLGVMMDDCGTGNAGASNAIDFGTGSSTNVVFEGFIVRSPTGKTLFAVAKEAGHTFSPATNRWRGNRVGTLSNVFQAYDSDEIVSNYPSTVIAEGGTAVGAGTYTRQVGTFMMSGKITEIRVELSYSAHTGTGPLEISLPVGVNTTTGKNMQQVNIEQATGITVTGSLVGFINTGATASGVQGAIRFYDRLANGTQTAVTVPTGAVALLLNAKFFAA